MIYYEKIKKIPRLFKQGIIHLVRMQIFLKN